MQCNVELETKRLVYDKNSLDFTLYNIKIGKLEMEISLLREEGDVKY